MRSGLLYMIPSFPELECPTAASMPGGAATVSHPADRTSVTLPTFWADTSGGGSYAGGVHLGLIAIVVSEYDPAIRFFVDVLGFELVEDSDATT